MPFLPWFMVPNLPWNIMMNHGAHGQEYGMAAILAPVPVYAVDRVTVGAELDRV